MTLRIMAAMQCDFCGNRTDVADGHKHVDELGRVDVDEWLGDYGWTERQDGMLMCPNHPRAA